MQLRLNYAILRRDAQCSLLPPKDCCVVACLVVLDLVLFVPCLLFLLRLVHFLSFCAETADWRDCNGRSVRETKLQGSNFNHETAVKTSILAKWSVILVEWFNVLTSSAAQTKFGKFCMSTQSQLAKRVFM